MENRIVTPAHRGFPPPNPAKTSRSLCWEKEVSMCQKGVHGGRDGTNKENSVCTQLQTNICCNSLEQNRAQESLTGTAPHITPPIKHRQGAQKLARVEENTQDRAMETCGSSAVIEADRREARGARTCCIETKTGAYVPFHRYTGKPHSASKLRH